jgi:hypothetical protein
MTPSQLEAARALLTETLHRDATHFLDQLVLGPWALDALRTLLSATAPPSEEELAEEAARHANHVTGEAETPHDVSDLLDTMRDPTDEPTAWGAVAMAYIAGARREGRK